MFYGFGKHILWYFFILGLQILAFFYCYYNWNIDLIIHLPSSRRLPADKEEAYGFRIYNPSFWFNLQSTRHCRAHRRQKPLLSFRHPLLPSVNRINTSHYKLLSKPQNKVIVTSNKRHRTSQSYYDLYCLQILFLIFSWMCYRNFFYSKNVYYRVINRLQLYFIYSRTMSSYELQSIKCSVIQIRSYSTAQPVELSSWSVGKYGIAVFTHARSNRVFPFGKHLPLIVVQLDRFYKFVHEDVDLWRL